MLNRKEKISSLRTIFRSAQFLLSFNLIFYILFSITTDIFRFYQQTIFGLEQTIRNNIFGIIGPDDGRFDNLDSLFGIIMNILSIINNLFTIFLCIELCYYYSEKRKLPPIYHSFLPKNIEILKELYIPLGIFNGIFFGISFWMIFFQTIQIDLNLFIILGLLPFFYVNLINGTIFFKKIQKQQKIKYFLSLFFVILFQF